MFNKDNWNSHVDTWLWMFQRGENIMVNQRRNTFFS